MKWLLMIALVGIVGCTTTPPKYVRWLESKGYACNFVDDDTDGDHWQCTNKEGTAVNIFFVE